MVVGFLFWKSFLGMVVETGISRATWNSILRYVYTGELLMNAWDVPLLLDAARGLGIDRLMNLLASVGKISIFYELKARTLLNGSISVC